MAPFAGIISGTGSLTKQNGSTVTITAAQTFTGGATISQGTLKLGASDRLADSGPLTVTGFSAFDLGGFSETVGSVTLNSGTIAGPGTLIGTSYQFQSGTVSANLAGAAALTKNGTGLVTLSGTNTYSGVTTISAGTLRGNSASLTGDILNIATLTFDQTVDGSYGGEVSGTGTLTKLSAGTLTLSSVSSYTGPTNIQGGTLRLGEHHVISSTSSIVISSGAILDLNGFNLSVRSLSSSGGVALGVGGQLTINNDSAVAFSGSINGAGSVTKQGSATLSLSGASGYSGGTNVIEGTLNVSGSERLADGGSVHVGGGQLTVGATETVAGVFLFNGSITGGTLIGAAYAVQSGSISADLAGAAALTKTTVGTVVLTGANTYAGGTTVTAGTLQGNTASLPGNMTNNAIVTFNQIASGTYSGAMVGNGSLVKQGAGTLTLAGSNAYAGGTTVAGGTLQGNTTSIQGNVAIDSNAATVKFDQASDGTFGGTVSGSGSLAKANSGTLVLTATRGDARHYLQQCDATIVVGQSGVDIDEHGNDNDRKPFHWRGELSSCCGSGQPIDRRPRELQRVQD